MISIGSQKEKEQDCHNEGKNFSLSVEWVATIELLTFAQFSTQSSKTVG